MCGELEQANDRWTLRFTRPLPHPPEKVWRAITEAEHLQAWFPQWVTGEWAVGAPLRFTDPGTDHPAFAGEVLACEPPRLLEYRWGTDVLRFEIVPDGSGCTLVLLEGVEAGGPHGPVGGEPPVDLLERLAADVVKAPLGVDPGFDQAGVA